MARAGTASTIFSHWHHPVSNFQTSPLEFYNAVTQALQPHRIPNLEISRVDWREGGVLSAKREYLRVKRGKLAFDIGAAPFGADFFFSSWLTEVPPTHGLLWAIVILVVGLIVFSTLTQSFGVIVGSFITIILLPLFFWLMGYAIRQGNFSSEVEDTLLAIPFFGSLYERIVKPVTYYKIDTTLMFQSAVHASVLEAVDQLFTAKGIRSLTELERKPIMREFLQK